MASTSHLVSGRSELLELDVQLWVAVWASGSFRLCSGLCAAKKTQTCDFNYDLHKDFSLWRAWA